MEVFFDQSEEARVSVERNLCESRTDDVAVTFIDRPFPGRGGQVGRTDEVIEPAVLPRPSEAEGVSGWRYFKGQTVGTSGSGDAVELDFREAAVNFTFTIKIRGSVNAEKADVVQEFRIGHARNVKIETGVGGVGRRSRKQKSSLVVIVCPGAIGDKLNQEGFVFFGCDIDFHASEAAALAASFAVVPDMYGIEFVIVFQINGDLPIGDFPTPSAPPV